MLSSPLNVLAAEMNPLGHVVDKDIAGAFTLHSGTLIIASLLTLVTLMFAARCIATGSSPDGSGKYIPRGRFAQIIETVCLYLRDNVARPQLGDATDKFMPYLWTLFFFILYNNYLGLIPLLDLQHLAGGIFMNDSHWAVIGGTATGNIAVTGALALIAFVIIQVNGLRSIGFKGWATHFLGGAPPALAFIMVPVEVMGMIIKPCALAVRLFANMVAGHMLLATTMGFTALGFAAADGILAYVVGTPIAIVSIGAGVALFFLEIFVATIQAFVFMFLTIIFISQLMHHHEEHEHADDAHAAAAH